MKPQLILFCLMITIIFRSSIGIAQEDEIWVRSIAWSSDSSLVALGYSQGDIEIIDIERQESIALRAISTDEIRVIDWHPNQHILAIASTGGIVMLIDSASLDVIKELPVINLSPITQLVWQPDGQSLFIAHTDGEYNVSVWNMESEDYLYGLDTISTTAIEWNASRSAISISDALPHIQLYDAKTLDYIGYIGFSIEEIRQQRRNGGIHNIIFDLAWHPNDQVILSGSIDGLVTLWDIASNHNIYQFDAPNEASQNTQLYTVEDVWFNESGRSFFSIAGDGTYRAWNTATGDMLLDFNIGSAVDLAEISPDKTRLAFIDEENELHIVEIRDLIAEQIRLKIDECVTNDEFHTKLNDLLDNEDIAELITQLESADTTSISTECAGELIDMANLLLEAKAE